MNQNNESYLEGSQGQASAKYGPANEQWKRGMELLQHQRIAAEHPAAALQIRDVPAGKIAFAYGGCTIFSEPGARVVTVNEARKNGWWTDHPENCDIIGLPGQSLYVHRSAIACYLPG